MGKWSRGSICVLLAICMAFWGFAIAVFAVEEDSCELVTASAFATAPMVSAGGLHTVALRSDGTVWTWGTNLTGTLGDGTISLGRNTPVRVQGLTNIRAIAAGDLYTLALRSDGTVWAWGDNWHGQLGDGTIDSRTRPVQVHGLTDVTAIAAGLQHSVALRSDGTVWTWGNGSSGQLGDGSRSAGRRTPVQVYDLDNVIAIAAGGRHTVALRVDGSVWTWGANEEGQLGAGIGRWDHFRAMPVEVPELNNVTRIATGRHHTVALRNDGTVWAWGRNGSGQLGDGTRYTRNTPVQVQEITSVTAIAAGGDHSLASRRDATLWTWGANWAGQLGDGSLSDGRTISVQMQSLSHMTSMAGGEGYTVALRNDGTVWAWGSNRFGELGDGTEVQRTRPVQVRGPNGVGYLNLGTAPPSSVPFADVRPSDWFYDAVRHVFEREIMRGTSGTVFAPSIGLDRAMVATILYRLAGEPPAIFRPIFIDVAAERWYSVPVTWAYESGAVRGVGGGRFAPDDSISREQLAAMMHRFARSEGYDVHVPIHVNTPEGTSFWAWNYMRWAVYNGFIHASNPNMSATRAETANFVFRFDARYGR